MPKINHNVLESENEEYQAIITSLCKLKETEDNLNEMLGKNGFLVCKHIFDLMNTAKRNKIAMSAAERDISACYGVCHATMLAMYTFYKYCSKLSEDKLQLVRKEYPTNFSKFLAITSILNQKDKKGKPTGNFKLMELDTQANQIFIHFLDGTEKIEINKIPTRKFMRILRVKL